MLAERLQLETVRSHVGGDESHDPLEASGPPKSVESPASSLTPEIDALGDQRGPAIRAASMHITTDGRG
jgi:hypothetical protein